MKQWLKCGIDMKALFTDGDLRVGTVFVGNVNGATMKILKIEPSYRGGSKVAYIQDTKTGNRFQYGFEALKRCDITIIRNF